MTYQEFTMLAEYAARYLRSLAPRDTGNLAENAIRLYYKYSRGEISAHIYINESIAPYMPYTNEPWLSPYWGGKQNPNEKWFDRAAKKIASELAHMLNGRLVINDKDN